MSDAYSVLVVDDEPAIARLLKRELESEICSVQTAHTAQDALQEANKTDFDVAVVDIRLPDARGIDLMQELRAVQPDMEVICITGHGTIGDAVEAMRLGAYDYITKPFNLEEMELVVERAYQKASLRSENRRLRHAHVAIDDLIVGTAPPMQEVRYLLERVAPTDVPVLLTGESGAGKEVLAHSIQRRSLRSEAHFVIKNCATLQKELARSELFGHVRGAFTGALHNSSGLFGEAHKGTLFLDEITEVPVELQTKLLHVLERNSFYRVGGLEKIDTDVRIIAATNLDFEDRIRRGLFRRDLYHRLKAGRLVIPPLRERKDDIVPLARMFLEHFSQKRGRLFKTIGAEAAAMLEAYPWPGNVRELRNVMEWVSFTYNCEELRVQHFDKLLADNMPVSPAVSGNRRTRTQRGYHVPDKDIDEALALHNGNKTKAARHLGIAVRTLYYHLERRAKK